jgi:hypothetical protein
MRPDHREQVKAIFEAALELEPASRESYARAACGGEQEIFADVMLLVQANSDATQLMNPGPAAAYADATRTAQATAPRSAHVSLKFARPLELEYAAEYFRRSLPRVRGAILLGTFLYAAFGILDSWVAPDHTRLLWFIRFAIVCPCALLVFVYSFSPAFLRHWQPMLTAIVLIAAVGIVTMIAVIPPPGSHLYSTGLLLLTIYSCTLVRLGFLYALGASIAVLLMYNAIALYTRLPVVVLFTTDMMLASGDVVALAANLALDRYNRRDFLQRREIASRTADLEVKNQQLTVANSELVRSREEILRSAQRNDLLFAALTEALPGTVLDGKYRLDAKIGAGGFGTVYRGFHLPLQRPVAVKLLKPGGGDMLSNVARFRQEGIAACRLTHPNAVNVLDFGVAGSVAYLVMELLEGRSLAEELEEHVRLTLRRCCDIVQPLCSVLGEAHRAGLVHRDLKPSNVFLHRTGCTEVVKIIDFGLAKILGPPDPTLQTVTLGGVLGGTPGYMAPERLTNGECDGRADVYSLGAVVYEMLSGERPFHSRLIGTWARLLTQLTEPPRPLCARNPLIPEPVGAVVDRALARDPEQRPRLEDFGWTLLEATYGVGVTKME